MVISCHLFKYSLEIESNDPNVGHVRRWKCSRGELHVYKHTLVHNMQEYVCYGNRVNLGNDIVTYHIGLLQCCQRFASMLYVISHQSLTIHILALNRSG